MSAGAPWWKILAVWLARVATGCVFAVSGWAKLVDTRGFVYKIDDYLAAWDILHAMPHAFVILAALLIPLVEFITGVLLLTGCLRRSAPTLGLMLMAVMLPLTAYIAIYNPVADCGCFGDLYTISNTATFVKNIVITALLVLCLWWRKAAKPLYRPGLQWLLITISVIYGLTIAAMGWQVQPVVDFRPYGVGKPLVSDDPDADEPPAYVYSKDGVERQFAMDSLPDSTWTFVRPAQIAVETDGVLAVFDNDGNEVTYDLFSPDLCPERMLVLAVTEPGIGNLTRARLANEIYAYAEAHDIEMVGIVALSGDALHEWTDIALPKYDVYSSSDTALKQMVRGPIGLVYLRNGKVVWKRNFATIDPDFLKRPNPIDGAKVVGDGHVARWLTGFYALGLLVLLAISALTKINIKFKRKNC